MEDQGFDVYEVEWWHFDYQDWRAYPILNIGFEKLTTDKAARALPNGRMIPVLAQK
jgi:hypothetical protein